MMTTQDSQLLLLLHQVQSHQITNTHVLLLGISMELPVSTAQKLNTYHWLLSLPLPELTPFQFTLFILLGPEAIVVSIFALILLFRWFIRTIVPFVMSQFGRQPTEKKFLELAFPIDSSKSAFATEELYRLLHTLSRQMTFWDSVIQRKNEYSLEIVSTKKDGIRYVFAASPKYVDIVKRNMLSFLPGIKVKEITDYLDAFVGDNQRNNSVSLVELKLKSHFALPLEAQKQLLEHDPISYITGNMTKLLPGELISLQIVVSPVLSSIHRDVIAQINNLRRRMYQGNPLTEAVQKTTFEKIVSLPGLSFIWLIVKVLWKVLSFVPMFAFSMFLGFLDPNNKSIPFLMTPPIVIPQDILNPYERELSEVIKGKIDQPLFEASIRLLVHMKNPSDQQTRLNGLLAAFGQMSSTYQAFDTKHSIIPWFDRSFSLFSNRTLSQDTTFNHNPILSVSELSDLFHFPFTDTTKTEDMVKVHSRDLPAPLSLKNRTDLDVIFGKNVYGDTETPIGLTDDDRSRHMYMIGQTGSGKSTVIYHMAKGDMEKGRGVAVIDPHGDLAEDLIAGIPESRMNDCIYVNPFDIKYPIGINLLELTPGLDEDELELEKELVCESVVSTLRRIFTKDENVDAHRIEYILRNAIYTAFTVNDATIFTVYDLLNNPDFQKSVTKTLDDQNLKNFWKNEFGKAGNYQVVKMVAGVTARIGRFLFSPTARRILEQPHSTINFDDILASGKILICNMAEGKLGEDTSQLLGTTMIAKIQQAAMRRVRTKAADRTPFYLFIDEFQNFATTSFTKLLSGGRKFGLRLTIAEQSTAQQEDRNVVNVILANTGTVLSFRTASPVDEELMLSQFKPIVTQSDIVNLPRFKFYMKLSAVEPEEPFSGETLPMNVDRNPKRKQRIIDASRSRWAIVYKRSKPIPPLVSSSTKSVKKPAISKEIHSLV